VAAARGARRCHFHGRLWWRRWRRTRACIQPAVHVADDTDDQRGRPHDGPGNDDVVRPGTDDDAAHDDDVDDHNNDHDDHTDDATADHDATTDHDDHAGHGNHPRCVAPDHRVARHHTRVDKSAK
jgi:hypothetical protein